MTSQYSDGFTDCDVIRSLAGVKKPFFVEPLQDQVVAEGAVVRLTTTFGGEPEPHIQWLCNNNPLQSSAVFKVRPTHGLHCPLFID